MGNSSSKKHQSKHHQPTVTNTTTSNNNNNSSTTISNTKTHNPPPPPSTTTNTTTTTTANINNTSSTNAPKTTSTTTTTTANTTTTTTTTATKSSHVNELEALFNKYQQIDEHVGESGADADYIGGDGIIQFVQDIDIDPMDVLVLMLLYKLDSKVQYRISRQEWTSGFNTHRIQNLDEMKSKIPAFRTQINSSAKSFKQFYNWCFSYVKERDQKGMAIEVACQTWRVILADKFDLLDDWCNFMQVEVGKAVQKDTWDLFLDFVQQVGGDLSKFDEGGAWPVAVDEFVAWMKEGKNVAVRERLQKEAEEAAAAAANDGEAQEEE